MRRKVLLIICCILCLLLSSCRSYGLMSDDFDAGVTVTPEELLEISRELFTDTSEPTGPSQSEVTIQPEEATTEAVTLSPDATVYWLEKGSVYHAEKTCHHISHASEEDLCAGKISEAMAAGKERLCSSCEP